MIDHVDENCFDDDVFARRMESLPVVRLTSAQRRAVISPLRRRRLNEEGCESRALVTGRASGVNCTRLLGVLCFTLHLIPINIFIAWFGRSYCNSLGFFVLAKYAVVS